MQDQYFDIGLGKWTTSIDWTAAVMNTHLVGVLASLSRSLNDTASESNDYVNNEISRRKATGIRAIANASFAVVAATNALLVGHGRVVSGSRPVICT